MPVIAVVNRKGGSGKSTLAAHLAAWCARRGHAVMLGDVDRQQSTRGWLRRRSPQLPAIAPWSLDHNVLRVPTGITHAVLDTPGGLHGFELARLVMFADAILIPVCPSLFDREAAARCHAELMTLPRVAQGRCRVAAVGVRVDARTRGAEQLRVWADGLALPLVGVLREAQLYVRTLECGLTLFDLAPEQARPDLAQWAPVLQWLHPVLEPPPAANDPAPGAQRPSRVLGERPQNPAQAQERPTAGTRPPVLSSIRSAAGTAPARPTAPGPPPGAVSPPLKRR